MMFNYEYFRKKKILIFLPHQDDEINTVYGMIGNIKKVDGMLKLFIVLMVIIVLMQNIVLKKL